MMYSGSALIELSESLFIEPALEPDPEPGGKNCELENRVMPTLERLFPRLLCCSIPLANIPAAASSSLQFNPIPHTSSVAVAVPGNGTGITHIHTHTVRFFRGRPGRTPVQLKPKISCSLIEVYMNKNSTVYTCMKDSYLYLTAMVGGKKPQGLKTLGGGEC